MTEKDIENQVKSFTNLLLLS